MTVVGHFVSRSQFQTAAKRVWFDILLLCSEGVGQKVPHLIEAERRRGTSWDSLPGEVGRQVGRLVVAPTDLPFSWSPRGSQGITLSLR